MNDAELGLLEQVTYIDSDVIYAARGIEKPEEVEDQIPFVIKKNESVGEAIERVLGKDAVENLRAMGDEEIGGSINSGEEWANIIENIQSDKNINGLVVKETLTQGAGGDYTNLAIAYENPHNPGTAIISYKGTSGNDEWNDNVEGLISSDTDRQLEAAAFAEKITGNDRYTDVIVTGHSKGANKAMYVTITDPSGKIRRCVAFDGQGFSNEFMAAYAAQIEARAGYITNYSIDRDFVHVLMKQIPGSNQIYCQGFGMQNGAEYHSPVSFFVTDENGNFLLDENGLPYFNAGVEENPMISGIRDFTTYIMDNSSPWEREMIVNTLGPFLGAGLGDEDWGGALSSLVDNADGWFIILVKIYEFRIEKGIGFIDMVKFIAQFIPDLSVMTVFKIAVVSLAFIAFVMVVCWFFPIIAVALEAIAILIAAIMLLAFVIALIKTLVRKLVEFVKKLVETIKEVVAVVVEVVQEAWDAFVSVISYAAGKIRDFTEAFLSTMLEIFMALTVTVVHTFVEVGKMLLENPMFLQISICDNVDNAKAVDDSMGNDRDEYEASIRDLFRKANEADDNYARAVDEVSTKIDELTSSFKTDFGIA